MNLRVTVSNLATADQTFKLQFSTSTGGTWTDVGVLGAGAQWRAFDNSSVVDGASLPTTLLNLSDVAESYEEINPSVANPQNVDANQRAEYDWVIQNNTSSPNTYFFRMVRGDGTALDSYANYPEIKTNVPVLGQQDYRWYANVDSVTPTTLLASENVPVTGSTPLQVLRLRINVDASEQALPASIQDFKLQFSVNTGSGPWTDLGPISSTVIWRAFDNPSVSSGSAIASLLLSASDVLETYEETNPSAVNPNAVAAGQKGEWDWAIQNNSAPTGTYYFRLVRGDGTALESYTNYPSISASGPTFTQRDYRWYANVNSATPTTPLTAENADHTGDSPDVTYRLRMNLELGGQNLPSGAQAFKLQFSTTTGGGWTDVGGLGSTTIWRGADNGTPLDGTTITTLLTSSNVGASYEEANPSVENPNVLNIGQRAEWDWVVQDNGATADTTYFFRMVRNDASELESYAAFPTITTPPPLVLNQEEYRWYDNRNNITPNIALAAENTPASGVGPLTEVRLRVNVGASGATLASGIQAFKLQFSTSTGGGWTDVGAIGSGAVWEGFSNGAVADGATITSVLLTASDVTETYEESNPSVSAPNAITAGQHGEWDWVLRYTTSPDGTYFFRMVKSDGTALDNYLRFSEIGVTGPSLTQQDYRWYQNRDNKNPDTPLAAENTQLTNAVSGTVYRLRMNIDVATADLPQDSIAFKLQYSTSTGGGWTEVGQLGSSSIWRGFDNPKPNDGDTIGAVLSSSDVAESYEEANPSVANPNGINQGQQGEWDWVVQDNSATADTTYFFRMVKSDGTSLEGYTNYPTLVTAPPIIASDDFESGGTNGGTGWSGAWTLAGDAAVIDKDKPHQGTFHVRLRRDTGVATRETNLSGKSNVRVQFWAKADSFEGSENATFSVSPDGTNFTILNTWVDGDDDKVYRFFDIAVPVGQLSSTFFIRFQANMGAANDRFYVDDLNVVGT